MSVEILKIANGLTVVLNHMPNLESVALGTWVKAGARNEAINEHGIAHVLEHMAFKGTKTRTSQQIVETIENVGGDINAATSIETTSYFMRLLGEDAAMGMDILHDILANSVFEENELEREKHVILQEIGAVQDTPDDVVFDNFQNAAFGGQPIGRPILGTPETVSAFTRNDIKSYLDKHYHGPNMVLAASGKIDSSKLLKQIKNLFLDFPDSPSSPALPSKYEGGEIFDNRPTEETHVILGFEGKAYQAKDFYASQLISMILGGGMSSRLFQTVRERHGLCYSIYSFHMGFSDSGIFGISAATGKEDLPKLMPLILDELKRAADDISIEEVDRARAQIRAGLIMSMESPASRVALLARQITLFGREVTNKELMERLEAISVERIRNLAEQLITNSKPTVSVVGDTDHSMNQQQVIDYLNVSQGQAAE